MPDYCLKGVRELCDEHGILLIFDEVQTFCRSNAMFAFEKSGITPDIVPIAKGIGGGFPLGACLLTKKVSVGMTPGTHGSTFGGNELACAVGNALCDIILEKDFFREINKYLDQQINFHTVLDHLNMIHKIFLQAKQIKFFCLFLDC